MQKYVVRRERKKIPIWLFIVLLLGILIVELYYFEILYKKRTKFLNVPDYKPVVLNIKSKLLFLNGDFPLSAKLGKINLFLFKGFSLTLSSGQILEIYSNKPYHLIFSDSYNDYEFFGKILYLRCNYGTN
jgi:hypothetical protein